MTYWLALADNKAAGCIGLAPLESKHFEVKTLHVLDAFRGYGIAIKLLHTLIDHAKQNGARAVSLETGSSPGFAASRQLYEKLGFVQCEKFGDYVNDPFSYCMRKILV